MPRLSIYWTFSTLRHHWRTLSFTSPTSELCDGKLTAGKNYAMTDDEQKIISFLASSPESFFARKEIARRAVKRDVYEQNPHWAAPALASLVMMGKLEQNNSGAYRLKQN